MDARPVPERAPGTRELLLETAERLFAEQGYDGVGIREIVAAAGANLAAIKYHFGSKRDLYLETVRFAMERQGGRAPWEMLESPPRQRLAAARLLVAFVRRFLERLLAGREVSACGLLMLREAMRPSEAIDAVVSRFTRPHQELVVGVIDVVRPGLEPRSLELAAHSVLAQVLHFMIQRAFLERQSEIRLADPRDLREVADHIARFSLRGLGCADSFVQRALEEGAEDAEPDEPAPSPPTEP